MRRAGLLVSLTALALASCASARDGASQPAATAWVPEPPAEESLDEEVLHASHQQESDPFAPKQSSPEEFADPPAPEPADSAYDGSAPEGLTLAALEQIALQNNPTLRQASLQVQQEQGNWLQAGLYPNPTVGYMGDEIGHEETAGMQGGFVSQTFITADKLQLSRAVAAQEIEQTRWQAEGQHLRVLNHVGVLYYGVLGAQRTVEVLEELADIARRGAEIAQQLYDAQQSPRTDVLQAEVDLASVELLLRNARLQQQAVRRQLAAVVGVPELPPVPVAGNLEGKLAPIDFEARWLQLQAASPVLQAARTQVERARAGIRREQAEPVPNIQTQGSVQEDFGSGDIVFGAQVGITLPIHNRNQGNIAAAAAELCRAIENLQRLELALRHELAETQRRLEVALVQVELYRDTILPKADETLRLTTEGYSAGEVDFLRVLTARRSYIENYIEYVAALTNARIAAVEIDGLLLVGGLDDPSQLGINPGTAALPPLGIPR